MTDDVPHPDAAVPADRLGGVWDDVIDDMAVTAEQYRDDGWTALELHPGDVTAAVGEDAQRWGLDVLLPGDEFEEVERLVADHDFPESEVFRAEAAGLVLLVVAMLDPDSRTAILVPIYYDAGQSEDFVEKARSEGEVRTHLRPLDERTVVTFTHEDPSLFLPGGGD